MLVVAGDHADEIRLRPGEHLVVVPVHGTAEPLGGQAEPRRIDIAHGDRFKGIQFFDRTGMQRAAAAAISEDGGANAFHLSQSSPP